ncbi:copper chaperone PCu(A)C [Roseovarius faecimaris]|uniref:Copper chaperone PCu(A)C n=1 Tax=Roseovarius faecimaris TaxID=2494550 RepID=A0A6I6IPX3_9RHOB|nr:copper chaperone PCu(A)C [Roseovarius faecimaris]QGX97256.1 copper chaperone PCu(A)C [Roseovarius faecimaris]
MSFKTSLFAGLGALLIATQAWAGEIEIHDPYARASSPTASSGAAFMMIHNNGTEDDRLVSVASPVAKRVELHTHEEDANGVMSMRHVEDGFAVPAGGMIMLQRGGHHVMFMGLNTPFEQGNTVPLTLVFEKSGEMEIEVPVDLERKDAGAHGHGQSN